MTTEDAEGTAERVPLVAVSPAFEDVYRSRYLPLFKLALVLSGNHHAAEELVQDTFLAAYRKWDSVGRYEYPDAWLRRVVVNKANSRLRRSYAETRARFRWASGRSEQVTMPEPTVDFWRELRSLSKRQAQALALFYLDGCSIGEIAAALGCAEATARVHLHRGRTALADRLGRST